MATQREMQLTESILQLKKELNVIEKEWFENDKKPSQLALSSLQLELNKIKHYSEDAK